MLIGIIPETELTGITNEIELKRIIYDALSVGPMLQPLLEDLKDKGQYDDKMPEIKMQDVVKALYSNSFLKACPNFVSRRETIANIKLITTALIITQKGYMTIEQIRHGLNAFVLECRETKQDYLYVMDDKVKRCLRLVNMDISDAFLKMWMDYCVSNLEWNNKERKLIKDMVSREYEMFVETKTLERKEELIDNFKKEKHNVRENIPYLMPHEFLFLLCNTHNRLDLI